MGETIKRLDMCKPLLETLHDCAKQFTISPCFMIASLTFLFANAAFSYKRLSFSLWWTICSVKSFNWASILITPNHGSYLCNHHCLLAFVVFAIMVCPETLFHISVMYSRCFWTSYCDVSKELVTCGLMPSGRPMNGRNIRLDVTFGWTESRVGVGTLLGGDRGGEDSSVVSTTSGCRMFKGYFVSG